MTQLAKMDIQASLEGTKSSLSHQLDDAVEFWMKNGQDYAHG